MNNKGYTLIELLVSITIAISLLLIVIMVPTYIVKDYKGYDKLAHHTSEVIKIKSVMSNDLESTIVKELEESEFQIGEVIYKLNDEGVYRVKGGKTLKVSDEQLVYKVANSGEGKVLSLYNEEINIEFSIGNSSFDSKE